MVPCLSIAKHLRELKSIFKYYSGLSAQQRGLLSEAWVCLNYLQKGYELRGHRYLTPYFEADLLFFHPFKKSLVLVEVKSLGHSDYLISRVRPAQEKRIYQAGNFLNSKYGLPVLIHWAFVGNRGEIKVLPQLRH